MNKTKRIDYCVKIVSLFLLICVGVILLAHENSRKFSPILFVIIPLIIIYVIRGTSVKYLGAKMYPAEEYLKGIVADKREISLILRPFGNDGHFSLSNFYSGNILDRTFVNWNKAVTIEQIIQEESRNSLNIETVALVDQSFTTIPTSPKYLLANHDIWKWVVFDLLKYAFIVFIIIPPDVSVGKSLVWEIAKAIQLGLIGRFVIIIPPQTTTSREAAIKAIKENLSFISPLIEDLPKNTIAIYPENHQEFHYWAPDKKTNQRTPEEISWSDYCNIVNEIILRVKKGLVGSSFIERHLYLNKDFNENDYGYTTASLELFLKKNNKPFDF